MDLFIRDLQGSSNLADILFAGLKRIEEAEECIAEFIEQYPQSKEIVDKNFKYLQPSSLFSSDISSVVYKHHCIELLNRMRKKEDLAQPTTAEVMLAFMGTSLKTPLDKYGSFFYADAFVKIFKGTHIDTSEFETMRDSNKYSLGNSIIAQAYGDICVKLKQAHRKLIV